MGKKTEPVNLKLTVATVWAGQIQRVGSILEDVPEDDAKRLLSKGKAVVATAEDLPKKPADQDDDQGGGEGEGGEGAGAEGQKTEAAPKKPAAKKAKE